MLRYFTKQNQANIKSIQPRLLTNQNIKNCQNELERSQKQIIKQNKLLFNSIKKQQIFKLTSNIPFFSLYLGMLSSNDFGPYSQIIPDNRKRIMNYKLIKVEGLPQNLALYRILISRNNFGRYGSIENLFLQKLKKTQDGGKNKTVAAYITYDSQISASLALLGTSINEINGHKITVNYGTNKYCIDFLDGKNCLKQKCFYLHTNDEQNEAHKPEHAKQKHFQRAFQKIRNNLSKVIQMQVTQSKQQSLKLKTIKKILQKMIAKNIFSAEDYERAKYKGKIVSQKIVLLKKNQNITEEFPSITYGQTNKQKTKISNSNQKQNSQNPSIAKPETETRQMSEERDQQINNNIKKKLLKQLHRKKIRSKIESGQQFCAKRGICTQIQNYEKINRIRNLMISLLSSE